MSIASKIRQGVTAGVLAAAVGAGALAVPLPPGSNNVFLPGTSVAAQPNLASVNLADTVIPFDILSGGGALLFRGELVTSVDRSNVTNTLIFRFRIRNTVAGLNGIVSRVEIEPYDGFMIDANWRNDGPGLSPPNQADRTGSGSLVNYDFLTPPLFSGSDSRFFFAFTNATEYNAEGRATIYLTTGEFVTLRVYAPGEPCDSCRGDVNGDGVVDFADLNEVLSAFGNICPPIVIP
jgi:hypothetical protein